MGGALLSKGVCLYLVDGVGHLHEIAQVDEPVGIEGGNADGAALSGTVCLLGFTNRPAPFCGRPR